MGRRNRRNGSHTKLGFISMQSRRSFLRILVGAVIATSLVSKAPSLLASQPLPGDGEIGIGDSMGFEIGDTITISGVHGRFKVVAKTQECVTIAPTY